MRLAQRSQLRFNRGFGARRFVDSTAGAVSVTLDSPPPGQYLAGETISIVGTVSPPGTPTTISHGITNLGSASVIGGNFTLDWVNPPVTAAGNLIAHAGGADSSPVSIEIVAASQPEMIFTVPFAWYLRGDTFVVGDSGKASQLSDKILGAGHTTYNFNAATTTNQPATLVSGGPNSRPCFRLDGVTSRVEGPTAPPGLDGGPRWRAIVIAARTPGSASTYSAAGTNTRHAIRYVGGNWTYAATTTISVVGQDQTWGLLIINSSGTTADYIEWRGNKISGTSAGAVAGTTPYSIGCNNGSTPTFGKFDVAEDICLFGGEPPASEIAAYKNYVLDWYGPGVTA